MGTTNDERREVARRLRDDAKGGALPYSDFFGAVAYDVGVEKEHAAVLNRLADLIEPEPERTCRVESSHEEEGDGCYSYFEYELTCGHEIAWGDQLPPSYCPECGRRVLYDSDDYI